MYIILTLFWYLRQKWFFRMLHLCRLELVFHHGVLTAREMQFNFMLEIGIIDVLFV